MTTYLVRAVAWYPRKTPDWEEDLVDRPKRPSPTPPRRWCDTTRSGHCRNLTIPVEAESAEEAERKAAESKYVEELRDIRTTRMETIK